MHIMQFVSTCVALILQEQIKNILRDVVGIGGYCFLFFCRQVLNWILLVLDHGKCFVSLVST